MSTAHHHAHNHHHAGHGSSRALVWVGLVFIVLGLAEIMLVPQSLTSGLVLADGLHNLADAAQILGAALAATLFARLFRDAHRRAASVGIVNLVLGIAGPLSYAAGLLLHEHHAHTAPEARALSLQIVIGVVSLAVNWACHRATHHHGHAGLSAHLLADSVGAAAMIVAALAAPFTDQAGVIIATTALNVMCYVAWRELLPSYQSVRHHLAQAPAPAQHDPQRSTRRGWLAPAAAAATIMASVFLLTSPLSGQAAHDRLAQEMSAAGGGSANAQSATQPAPQLGPPSLAQLPATPSAPGEDTAGTADPAAGPPDARHYTVVPDDNLSVIAAGFGLTGWQPLYEANHSSISDPNLIYPGQILVIPHVPAS